MYQVEEPGDVSYVGRVLDTLVCTEEELHPFMRSLVVWSSLLYLSLHLTKHGIFFLSLLYILLALVVTSLTKFI